MSCWKRLKKNVDSEFYIGESRYHLMNSLRILILFYKQQNEWMINCFTYAIKLYGTILFNRKRSSLIKKNTRCIKLLTTCFTQNFNIEWSNYHEFLIHTYLNCSDDTHKNRYLSKKGTRVKNHKSTKKNSDYMGTRLYLGLT